MTKISAPVPKITAISSNLPKCMREAPSPPSSYAPVVLRKCRIPLLTKFTMVKQKIDFLSVSTIFLKGTLMQI